MWAWATATPQGLPVGWVHVRFRAQVEIAALHEMLLWISSSQRHSRDFTNCGGDDADKAARALRTFRRLQAFPQCQQTCLRGRLALGESLEMFCPQAGVRTGKITATARKRQQASGCRWSATASTKNGTETPWCVT